VPTGAGPLSPSRCGSWWNPWCCERRCRLPRRNRQRPARVDPGRARDGIAAFSAPRALLRESNRTA
jgi:hypothetical protein